jgi:integrase
MPVGTGILGTTTTAKALATVMANKKLRGIYQRGNIFWLTQGSGGNRIQKSLETSDYAEAVAKAQEILNNPVLNTTNGFLADLNDFINEQVKNGVWTKNSKNTKTSVLMMFGEDLGLPPLPKITKANVQHWYDQQVNRIKTVTANAYITDIKAFLNWAVGKRIIHKNPADEIELREVKNGARVKFCSFEDRDKIINGAPTEELKFVLYAGFFAGFRKNEIIESRPDWFDMKRRHIHVKATATFTAKDKEERTIPMSKQFHQFLKGYGSRGPFMIAPTVTHGKGQYRYDFRKPYADYMASIGFAWVTPHVMRHTFASLLASEGCSLFKIATWLGDTEATTQKHYAHLIKSDVDIELLNGKKRKKR